MSSVRYAPPLVLERRPSRRLAALLLAIHGAGLLALVLPMDVPVWGRLVLGGAILLSGREALRREAWLTSSGALVRLGWSQSEHWWLETRDGVRLPARLREDSLVLPSLLILRFDLGRHRVRSAVVPSDGAEADALRRLRVRLRHEPALRTQDAG